MAKIKVTKLEAAQRQIDAAIRMLFANEDPVAIHSIAAAGSRILRDLAKQKQTDIWKMMNDCIRPEMREEFWGAKGMNRFANFLKHADIDPTEIIDDVDDIVNDYMIFFACLLYVREYLIEAQTAAPLDFFGCLPLGLITTSRFNFKKFLTVGILQPSTVAIVVKVAPLR